MKKIIALAITVLLIGCSQEVPTEISQKKIDNTVIAPGSTEKNYSSLTKKMDFTVAAWGPQETIENENPNPQPDSGMGIWIKLSKTPDFNKAKIKFGEKTVVDAVVSNDLITASIPKEQLLQKGIKQVKIVYADNETLLGTFTIK